MKGKVLQLAAPTATATAILVAHLMFVFLNASAPTLLRETVRLASCGNCLLGSSMFPPWMIFTDKSNTKQTDQSHQEMNTTQLGDEEI